MSTNKILEQNIISSFNLAKNDIKNIYAHLRFVLEQMEKLKSENAYLSKKITELNYSKVKVTKEYVASKAGKKIHSPGCVFAKNIKQKNKIVFFTKTKALKEGFKLCNCLAY